MLRPRLAAADPGALGCGGLARGPRARGRDGNRFAAFAATPDEPSRLGIVILPDVRGLYRFYEELALRFAERGYPAVAIDYFGRTAGVAKRGDDFEYMPHVEQTTQDGVQADTARAQRSCATPVSGSVFTVGFCFGGRNSWLAAAAATGSPERSASTAGPARAATARRGRRSARASWPRRSSG